MRKELKRLNPRFQAYATSLIANRGWTPTMATETAKMRQAAASRVAKEERQLRRDREDEELVREMDRAQSMSERAAEEHARELESARRRRELETEHLARALARAQRAREMETEEHARELARDQSRRAGEAAAAAIAAQTAANLANMENQDDAELQWVEEDLEGLYYNFHDEDEDGGDDDNDDDGTNDRLEMEYEGDMNAGVMVGSNSITAQDYSVAVPPEETHNEGVDMSGAPSSGGATDS
jgi:hypothetical protein